MHNFSKEAKKNAPVTIDCNQENTRVTAIFFRTKEEKADTREIRTCAYVLRKTMSFEGFNKNILDVDFWNKTVLGSNVRVAHLGFRTCAASINKHK